MNIPPDLIPVAAIAMIALLLATGALMGLIVKPFQKSVSEDRAANATRDELTRRLAGWTQPLISLISGAAPTGAAPHVPWSRTTITVACLVILFGGVSMTSLMFALGVGTTLAGTFGIAIGMVLVTGGARAIMTTVLHDCVHQLAHKRAKHKDPNYKGFDYYLGSTLATLLQTQRFEDYYQEHIDHHKKSIFGHSSDPDYKFLLSLGFRPGMKARECWVKYLTLLVSPWFHARFFIARLWSRSADPLSFAISVVYGIVLYHLGSLLGWSLVASVWLVPCFLLLHAAALTQFTSEHRWGQVRDGKNSRALEDAKLTGARFCADRPPQEGLAFLANLLSWLAWWYRLLTIHLICRVAVVPLDLVHHDLHHHAAFERLRSRYPELPLWCNWMNSMYARQYYEQLREPSDPPCTEFWGIEAALEATFKTWAQLRPVSSGCGTSGTINASFA